LALFALTDRSLGVLVHAAGLSGFGGVAGRGGFVFSPTRSLLNVHLREDPKARSYNGIVGEHIVVACTRRQLLREHEFARNRPYIKASEVLSQRSGASCGSPERPGC